MKKSSKAILFSCLSVLPVVPTVAMLTSCNSPQEETVPTAVWSADFATVKVFTGVNTIEQLKAKMTSETEYKTFLPKVCIPLNISLSDGEEVQLVPDTLRDYNNSLYFSFNIGRNLADNNALNTTTYLCSITDINPSLNNVFDNKLANNSVVDANKYQNQLTTMIALEAAPIKQSSITSSSISGNSKISPDSKEVQDYINTLTTNYTIIDTVRQQKSNLKFDLEFLIKDTFYNNLKEWKVPYALLKEFNPFGSINVKQNTNSSVDVNFCFQFQNNSTTERNFKFLGLQETLNKNELLTVEVNCLGITKENVLTVNEQGNVCLKLANSTVKYQKGRNKPITLNNQLLNNEKSNSINEVITNIGTNNNPFNEKTQNELNKIFEQNKNKLTLDQIKAVIEEKTKQEFAQYKKEFLASLGIVEMFAVPLMKDSIPNWQEKYDVDKNGEYTFLDLISNLGKPFGELSRLKGLNEAAGLLENLFSNKPLYLSFRGMFPTLTKVLRGLNVAALNDIVNFLEQSLTVNGQLKTEQQFRDFFVNISNLKEVVKPLLQNGGAITGYQLELVLQLIDTLAENPDTTSLWMWLSNNIGKIFNLLNELKGVITLPAAVAGILNELSNFQVIYGGKPCNILTEIPVYNIISRNGLNIPQPIGLLKQYYNLLDGMLPGVLGSLFKNTLKLDLGLDNLAGKTAIQVLQFFLRILSGWKEKGFNLAAWQNTYKNFFVPQTIEGQPNKDKTMKQIFEEDSTLFTLENFVWSDISTNEITKANGINKKLEFTLKMPSLKYTYKTKPALGNPKDKTCEVKSVKYTYLFTDSTISPVIKQNDLSTDISWKASLFRMNDSALEDIFCASPEKFINSNINSDVILGKDQKYFNNYSDEVFDDTKNLNLTGVKCDLAKTDIIETGVTNYWTLTNEGYEKVMNALFTNEQNKRVFNTWSLKPIIYIWKSGAKYKAYLHFPVKVGLSGGKFDNVQSFDVKLPK